MPKLPKWFKDDALGLRCLRRMARDQLHKQPMKRLHDRIWSIQYYQEINEINLHQVIGK